jgi:hypothetical protein
MKRLVFLVQTALVAQITLVWLASRSAASGFRGVHASAALEQHRRRSCVYNVAVGSFVSSNTLATGPGQDGTVYVGRIEPPGNESKPLRCFLPAVPRLQILRSSREFPNPDFVQLGGLPFDGRAPGPWEIARKSPGNHERGIPQPKGPHHSVIN